MQIFVKLIDGETVIVETSTDTVDNVKQKVEEIEGIPVDLQQLLFESKELENGHELSQYKVGGGSTLHLTMDLEGGYMGYDIHRGYGRYLATRHLLFKKICRKCYGRLSPNATRCGKSKCGRTSNIRYKKTFIKRDLTMLLQRNVTDYYW